METPGGYKMLLVSCLFSSKVPSSIKSPVGIVSDFHVSNKTSIDTYIVFLHFSVGQAVGDDEPVGVCRWFPRHGDVISLVGAAEASAHVFHRVGAS